jgi:HlyD family secretion protein
MLKRNRRLWMLSLLTFAAAAAGLMYWRSARGGQPLPDMTQAESAPITLQSQWIHGVGYVEPRSEVRRLIFRTDGVIDKCNVRVGERVTKGQILMTLWNRDQAAAVQAAERDVEVSRAEEAKVAIGVDQYQIAAARSKAERLQEEVRHMRREHERTRRMFQNSAASDVDNEQARTRLAQAEASMRNAEAELQHLEHFVRPEDLALAAAKVRQAEARLAVARERLEDTFLTAPCTGTVLEILKREGEGQRLIDAEPALVFADLDRVRIRAEIDERHARRLCVGQRATAFGRGLGMEAFSGNVIEVRQIMGKKTVFARTAQERKDLDVLQVLIEMEKPFSGPVGLRVDVKIASE